MKNPLIFLTIIFIVLKVLDKIDWNWFLVVSPFLVLVLILATIESIKDNK